MYLGAHMLRSIVRTVLLALTLAGGGVFAQPVPATDPVPRVAFPRTNVGNVSTFGPRTADAANAAKFSFGVATNGAIFANTGDRLPTPGGASIPIGINGTIAKPNVSAAIGRFARKALPVLSVGVALYDLGNELGFGLDNSGGPLVVTKAVTPGPTAWSPFPTFSGDGMLALPTAGCSLSWTTAGYCRTGSLVIGYVDTATKNALLAQGPWTWQSNDGAVHRVYRALPGSLTYPANQPSSVDEFEDAIAAKPGWAPSSALARAAVDAIKSGESLQVDPQTVTGPATSPGPSSTTVNPTSNTTTISAATHHYTYTGPSVSISTVTNTSTINNVTQDVISETETTDNPVVPDAPAAEEMQFTMPCGVAGTPACAVKLDEAGTPTDGGSRFDAPSDGVDEQSGLLSGLLDTIESWDIGSWTWTFALPTGCVPLDMFHDLVIDPCQWLAEVHDIMSVIWILTGIAGLFAIYSRAF